jgi:hypothetical protein
LSPEPQEDHFIEAVLLHLFRRRAEFFPIPILERFQDFFVNPCLVQPGPPLRDGIRLDLQGLAFPDKAGIESIDVRF